MSKPTAQELLRKQNYYPCLFFVCKHNENHRHSCNDCHKYMLVGEEQLLVAYYEATYDYVGGPQAKLMGYDVICRLCHPGVVDKGFHYGELIAANRVV